MTPRSTQEWIDQVQETSAQQWMLRIATIVAPVAAVLAASAASSQAWAAGTVMVGLLGAWSVTKPESLAATFTIVAVVWRWLVAVESLSTPWLPVAAVCLLVFHALVTLQATLPTGAELPKGLLLHWSRNCVAGAGVTVGMWACVVAMDQRDAPGNGLVTAVCLAVIAAGATAVRTRSLD